MAIGVTHLVGFATGVALYAMLLSLALTDSRSAARRADALAAVTGILGLFWNAGSLAAYLIDSLQQAPFVHVIEAISYSALGFLPAAVVHSVLRSEARRSRITRALVYTAYALSVVGAGLQIASAAGAAAMSATGLRVLTIAFVLLVVPLILVTRKRLGRGAWIASLALFAISGFHLSERHIGEYSWGLELLGHHASLPLAFAILFFDYRFALADLFLKRALTLVAMVALTSAMFGAVPLVTRTSNLHDAATQALLVAVAIVAMLVYPKIRKTLHAFVDRAVLGRSDYATLLEQVGATLARADSPEVLLDAIAPSLGAAVAAAETRWVSESEGAAAWLARVDPTSPETAHAERHGVEWSVPVPTTERPRYAFIIGPLAEGRRLLSDDLAMLESAALIVARRIDALRLLRERVAQGAREQELSRLTTEAELRALRAQIQPHFLFNALNTIGYLIRTSPDRAFGTLMQLTTLLRGLLRSSGATSSLEEELKLVESYLEVERARFEERLRVAMSVPRSLYNARIPTLILQPLVENAIKHGISPLRQGGEISIEVLTEKQEGASMLILRVRDDGAGATAHALQHGRGEGIGLSNVEQRLRAHYGAAAAMTIDSAPGVGTVVTAVLPLQHAVESAPRAQVTGEPQ